MPGPRPAPWLTRGVSVGRLLGIPVAVTPSWFLSIALIAVLAGPAVGRLVPTLEGVGGYAFAVLLALLLGVSVLAHELGHCIVARRHGVGVVRIELFLLGGVSEIAQVPRSASEEAQVAAAGIVVSALLTGLFTLLTLPLTNGTAWWLLALDLAVANGIITVFNVLPALPLDGGRLLRAGLWRVTGRRRRATSVAVAAGYLLVAVLLVLGVKRLFDGGVPGLIQGAILIGMGIYIAAGARGEQVESDLPEWPPGVSVRSLARPALNLPAETPVGLALRSAAGREVILVGPDGGAQSILDGPAAESVAAHSPQTPAGRVAQPVGPDTIVLFSDGPAEVSEQLRTVGATHFLLIGEDGAPEGVLRREDVPRSEDRR